MTQFSILISTKNRCNELLFTLNKIKHLFGDNVSCLVYDDGSTDETFEKVKAYFPEVEIKRNETSKGYMFCRNKMLNETIANFAISLDDDAHFLTENPLQIIENYFNQNPKCGLIATRIFWDKNDVEDKSSHDNIQEVKSFIGCGHIWRMKAWHTIPNYPEWFQFYGEENFASLQLFKNHWKINYVPALLIQHRVDLIERAKSKTDFAFRFRSAVRADWYNYFLFFPLNKIPRKMSYSLWMQFKNKIFRGNFKVVLPLFLALLDLFLSVPKLIKHRNALTTEEYNAYLKLNDAKIYWKPEK